MVLCALKFAAEQQGPGGSPASVSPYQLTKRCLLVLFCRSMSIPRGESCGPNANLLHFPICKEAMNKSGFLLLWSASGRQQAASQVRC